VWGNNFYATLVDGSRWTLPERKWRFDALAATVRYECAGCGHQIKDTPADPRWSGEHRCPPGLHGWEDDASTKQKQLRDREVSWEKRIWGDKKYSYSIRASDR